MPKFRKKPVVIEAWEWNETVTLLRQLEAIGLSCAGCDGHVQRPDECTDMHIRTLEGAMRCAPGDFIIKGVKGEFYPCKPDIFAATYEPVEDESPRPVTSIDLGGGWTAGMDNPAMPETSSYTIFGGSINGEVADARLCRALFAAQRRADDADAALAKLRSQEVFDGA